MSLHEIDWFYHRAIGYMTDEQLIKSGIMKSKEQEFHCGTCGIQIESKSVCFRNGQPVCRRCK